MKSEHFCPVDSVIELIGNRSTLLILRELFGGAKRTGDLLAAIGISSATLLEHLRLLEGYEVVQRVTYPESPPRVEYQLTDKGWDLQPVMTALRDIGSRWNSQNCYDAENEHEETCTPCHLNRSRSGGDFRPSPSINQPVQIKRNDVFML
ncbi:MAG TPA: helix-turn-helix domain-containing protein [Blastocatellia bacterium]|nr:helix-turn-helix domain-containing protein [Blastocatellia bacterium]